MVYVQKCRNLRKYKKLKNETKKAEREARTQFFCELYQSLEIKE